MTRLLYSILAVTLIFVGQTEGFATKKRDVEKRKVVEKSYSVDEDVTLVIENKFGKVHINTWDKKQMDVRVEVIARRRSESRAQELLDKIDIDIDESSSSKRFTTDLQGRINNRNSESFEINYTVSMPKSNPLELKNSFGDTYIGDLNGDVDIKVSYGDLRAKKLEGRSRIKLSFGDGDIEYVRSGEMVVKYSNLDVSSLGVVRLEQGFSELDIRTAESIDMTSKYGEVLLGSIKGIRGYVGFTDFVIEKLLVELDLQTSYAGGFEIEEVGKNFKKINLEGKFGSYRLGFEEGVNGRFEARLKFSEFRYSGADVDLNYQVKEDFKGEYRGKIGNGEGGEIRIVSSYGDVRFD